MQARYGLLMQQTDKFAGDFANTADGAANAQRVLSAELENFQAAIGSDMLPAMAKYIGLAADLLETGTALAELRFSDAMDSLMPSIDELVAKASSFMTLGLSDVLENVGLSMDGAGEAVHDLTVGFGLWGDTVEESARKAELAARINDNEYSKSIDTVATAIEMAEHENKRYSTAQDLVTASIEDAISAHQDETQAIKDKTAANRSSVDAAYAARDAEDSYMQSLQDTTDALANSELSERDKAAAVRDSVRALDDMVLAQLEEQGVSADSVLGQQMWKESMELSASYLSGPLREEVDAYIGRVSAIPDTATTIIDADIRGANANLDELMRKLEAVGIKASAASIVASSRFRQYADGTNYHPGGFAIVGERGPELVELPQGSKVHTAPQTAAMFAPSAMFATSRPAMSAGGSTMTVVNNVSVQSLDAERAGQVITDSLNAFYQAGGQPARG